MQYNLENRKYAIKEMKNKLVKTRVNVYYFNNDTLIYHQAIRIRSNVICVYFELNY